MTDVPHSPTRPRARSQSSAVVRALFRQLPKPGGPFALEGRAAWLRTMASAFDTIYARGSNDGDRAILVATMEAPKVGPLGPTPRDVGNSSDRS